MLTMIMHILQLILSQCAGEIGGQRPYYLKDLSGKEGLYEVGKRQYCDAAPLILAFCMI